jgi:hypothetical protein
VLKWHVGGVKDSLDRRGGLPHYFPYARDELRFLCCCQFHSLASACVELLSHARSIGVVEKPDFAHARARVRYPLDRVLWKCVVCVFWGSSAQRGGPWRRILPRGSYPRGRTCASYALLSLVACFGTLRGRRTRLAHVRSGQLHSEGFLPPSVQGE